MTRIRMLNDQINAVDTEEKARKLVKVWLGPSGAREVDQEGVKNCSLIASFAIHYINMGVVDYEKLMVSQPVATIGPSSALPFNNNTRADVLYLVSDAIKERAAHEVAVLREGATYGLFHAWADHFHVFPQLNPSSYSPNVFGEGDDAIQRVTNMLTRGENVGGCRMPRYWDVRSGWMARGRGQKA